MTHTRPTSDQINAEIETLETMKPHVRQWSAFKDDNHAAIDAQVRVLRERLGSTAIHNLYSSHVFTEDDFGDSDFDENAFHSALDAFNWMTGGLAEPAPSIGWAEMVPAGAVIFGQPGTKAAS